MTSIFFLIKTYYTIYPVVLHHKSLYQRGKKMKRYSKSILMAITLLPLIMLTGCVTYYTVSDANKFFNDAVKGTQKIIKQAEDNLNQSGDIITGILVNIDQKEMTPYPELDKHLQRMSKKIDDLRAINSEISSKWDTFKEMSEGQSRISSDEKEYDKLKKLRGDVKKLADKFEKKGEEYRAEYSRFKKTAEENGIAEVSIKEITAKVDEFNVQVNTSIKDAEKKIGKARDSGQASNKEKMAILDSMEMILADLKKLNDEINILKDKFEIETATAGETGKFWVGPGMVTHTIIGDIRKNASEMQDRQKELQTLAEDFNS
jgi:uncharacterized protein YukE